jgi:hypothetical protein
VREKHCFDWKKKLKSTDYKSDEQDLNWERFFFAEMPCYPAASYPAATWADDASVCDAFQGYI